MSGSCYYIALRSAPDICDICEVHHYFVSFAFVRVSEKKTRELCLPFCEPGREMRSYKHSRSTTFTFNSISKIGLPLAAVNMLENVLN